MQTFATVGAVFVFGFVACAHSARSAAPPPVVAPAPTAAVAPAPAPADAPLNPPATAPADSGAAAPAHPTKNQPPSLKLKLGHFKNAKLGIGATIDLSEHIDNIAAIVPAKLRFDGETKVWHLKGQHGPSDRIDYARDDGSIMLHVWKDGRRAVYVQDPDNGKWSDEIDLIRDGDANPL